MLFRIIPCALVVWLTGCGLLGDRVGSAAPLKTAESGQPDTDTNTDTNTDTDTETGTDTGTGTRVLTPLLGFWGLNGYISPEGLADVQTSFGITGFQVASADPSWTVRTLLPMVRDAGLRVTLRLTEDHTAYAVNGNFDITLWKEHLSSWQGSGVQAFIDDGTLVGHMLIDDITIFAGRGPNAADLEEMARYSKEVLPGLMTFVRESATDLPHPENGQYLYLDAAVNQYTAEDGRVEQYADVQQARAAALGLGVINGLNIADGGDGSAQRHGFRPGHYPMTAAEITAYGTVLANVPACGMFLNWEYDGQQRWADGSIGADYFDQPELQAALADLAALFATHPPVALLKDSDAP